MPFISWKGNVRHVFSSRYANIGFARRKFDLVNKELLTELLGEATYAKYSD